MIIRRLIRLLIVTDTLLRVPSFLPPLVLLRQSVCWASFSSSSLLHSWGGISNRLFLTAKYRSGVDAASVCNHKLCTHDLTRHLGLSAAPVAAGAGGGFWIKRCRIMRLSQPCCMLHYTPPELLDVPAEAEAAPRLKLLFLLFTLLNKGRAQFKVLLVAAN